MAYLSDYEYHEGTGGATNEHHGSYQHRSLKDIVNNFMLMYTGPDQIINSVPTYKVRFHAKEAIKELNYDALNSTRIVEDKVQSSLKYIMPSDYVDFIRISKLVDGKLYVMNENRNAMSANVYLRDNSNEILFDNNGETLIAGSSELEQSRVSGSTNGEECHRYEIGGKYGLDTSTANSNPTFKVNKRAGVIDFDSSMSGATIVLEYISDGMEGGNDSLVVVNKFFEKYIYAYISYSILDTKSGIADNVKTRARQKQRALWQNAKIRTEGLNPIKLLMTMRGANKWNKG